METTIIEEKIFRTTGEVWSDLHHDIIPDKGYEIKRVLNIDSVKTSIDNILRTYKGERVMLPEFGSGLRGLVFENMTDGLMNQLADEVRETILRWDDRIIINSVSFAFDPKRHSVVIQLSFAIVGYDNVFAHSLDYPMGG